MNKVQSTNTKSQLEAAFKTDAPQWKWSEQFGDTIVEIPAGHVLSFFKHCKESGLFDFLMDITAVDYPGREKRFEVVYELFNTTNFNRLRVKVPLSTNEEVPTLTKIWRGADWFERETFDMFGIKFTGHLNLRRILTHHQFEGHPLRKDYDADRQQPCTSPLPIHFDNDPNYKPTGDEGLVPLNIGPSHPATHGTLRVMAELKGRKSQNSIFAVARMKACTTPWKRLTKIG